MTVAAVRVWTFVTLLAWLVAGCGTASVSLFVPTLGSLHILASGAPSGGLAPADFVRQDAADQTPIVTFVKTVGLKPDECASTRNVDIFAGTAVYYCYTLTNNGDTPIRAVSLLDTYYPGSLVPAPIEPAEVEAGSLLQVVVAIPNDIQTNATTVDTTASAEWTVESNGTVSTVSSNPTTVNIAALSTLATLTVGTDRNTCASTTALTNVAVNSTVYYCLKLQNNSDVTVTNHLLTIPPLNLIDFPVSYAVAPRATMMITTNTPAAGAIPQMAHGMDSPALSSQAIVTSTTAGGLPVSTISTPPTTLAGVPATLSVVKSLNTDPKSCTNIASLQANYKDKLYYCLVITNSNSFTYTSHSFAEPASQIAASFNAPLPPGGRITLTNETLPSYGVSAVLGPIEARTSFNNTLNYTATNPTYNYMGVANASASVIVLPPTPRATDEPTPTFTPFPSSTPLPTAVLTPIPPTPTFPPTWTPSPTFTPSPTVLAFTTPGGVPPTPYPQIGPGGLVPSQPGTQNGFVSPLDPFAAATATAAVLYGFVTPVIDTFAATATAAALFGVPPPPLDPFAATATAAALFGYPTTILDPAGATATAAVMFGLVPPGSNPLDPFGATATTLALAQQVPSPLEPAPTSTPAAVAIIPPPVTIITVTATPTLTPIQSPTQRPIEPPTPLPPVDVPSVFTQVVDAAGMTMALIWFLAGSILFFVTAGVLAGLSFRAKERGRFDLTVDDDILLGAETAPGLPLNQPSSQSPEAGDDGNWPASLT